MDKQKEKRGKKRNKSYYLKSSQQKRTKLNRLEAGLRGFLVTCNRDEKQAVRESYNVLNEYADILYGVQQEQSDSRINDCDDNSEESSDDDMEKAMCKEVKDIQESQTRPRRFQNCFTNAKNCIFISTTLENPCELVHNIFADLAVKKTQKTRFAMRLLPVAGTCKAYMEDIKKLAEQILSPHFSTPVGEGKTYGIVFRVRNNNGISRQAIMPMMGQLIADMNPLHRVHLDNPDLVVLVEVVCGVCCMSVVKDFYKFRKYNFHEVIKDSGSTTKKNAIEIGDSKAVEEKMSVLDDSETIEEKIREEKPSIQVGDSEAIKEKTSTQVGNSEEKRSLQVENSKTIEEKPSVPVGNSEAIQEKTSTQVGNTEEEKSIQVENSKTIEEKPSIPVGNSEAIKEKTSTQVDNSEEKRSLQVENSKSIEEKTSIPVGK